jgi:methylenetetrahydrofolate reductase (NADPH)
MTRPTLESLLKEGKKIITAEVTPPHGTNTEHFLKTARLLNPYVHCFNITDNQRALMRMSGLASAALLVREGMEPIYQLTCRDRNVLALQSDLLGACALGVKNVLALTGDPVGAGDTPDAKGVFQFEATGLLNLIKKLNDGVDVTNKPLNGHLNILAGAVVNPGGRAMDPQIKRLEKKMKAGAQFFQTQAVFSQATMQEFMTKVRPTGAKIIAGVLLVRTLKTAHFLQDKVPGIFVPPELFDRLEKAENPEEAGIDFAAGLVKDYLQICDGVHLMAIRSEEKLIEVLKRAGQEKLYE